MKFSIIVPAYKEEKNLEAAVRGLVSALDKYDFRKESEIIIFDDNSPDNTGKIADQLAREIAGVRVFHNEKNMGLGFNFMEGARQARGEFVTLFPGDNECLPEPFVRAFAHVGKTDIVVIYTSNPEVRPFSRRVVSSTYTFINNVLFGLHVRYYNGLNIFRRDLLLKLPPIGNSFSYAAEILVSLLKSGATYIELPMELVPKKMANTSAFRLKNIVGVIAGIGGLFWRIRVKNNIFSGRVKLFKSFSKKVIKFFIYNALSILPSSSGVVILMYHSIGENKEFFTVNMEEFERQMKYLKDNGFRVIKLEDLVNLKGVKNLNKTVVITFDDGYRDNYMNAFPILKNYGFPATIFVSTSLIGNKKIARKGTEMEILSVEEIRGMQKGGLIDFGSHCYSHPKLTDLENGQIEKEFTLSKKTLSDILDRSPLALAYPYGNYDERVSNIAKKFFDITVTVKKGKEKGIDLLDLKRNSIDSKTNFWEFKKIVKFGKI